MGRRWTEEEDQFMADNIGVLSYEEISVKIDRSIDAMKNYRCVNRLPSFFNHPNSYSYTVLSKELGKTRKWLRKCYKAGLLKGKQGKWYALWGHFPMVFLEKDIVDFLKECCWLIDPAKVTNLYFKNVVLTTREKEQVV